MANNPACCGSRRLPAEWEMPSAVLLAWPHTETDWAPIIDDARRCVADIARALLTRGVRVVMLTREADDVRSALADCADSGLITVDYLTNDTWARDFGPITVMTKGDDREPECLPIDFGFNGWGLKFAADRDNLATLGMYDNGLFCSRPENRRSFILEGGSIDSDGIGRVLTTSHCLMSPNRNGSLSREAIEAELRSALGAEKILWLHHGALAGDDTDSHIDTLARFAPGGKILYDTPSGPNHPDREELDAMAAEIEAIAEAEGLTAIALPLPEPITDPEDGHLLPATYANFLALPGLVLVPSYGQPEADAYAAAIIADAFEGCEVVSIDCRVLIRQHGSLHCMTMQIPLSAL